jgi:hypothetical protein
VGLTLNSIVDVNAIQVPAGQIGKLNRNHYCVTAEEVALIRNGVRDRERWRREELGTDETLPLFRTNEERSTSGASAAFLTGARPAILAGTALPPKTKILERLSISRLLDDYMQTMNDGS